MSTSSTRGVSPYSTCDSPRPRSNATTVTAILDESDSHSIHSTVPVSNQLHDDDDHGDDDLYEYRSCDSYLDPHRINCNSGVSRPYLNALAACRLAPGGLPFINCNSVYM